MNLFIFLISAYIFVYFSKLSHHAQLLFIKSSITKQWYVTLKILFIYNNYNILFLNIFFKNFFLYAASRIFPMTDRILTNQQQLFQNMIIFLLSYFTNLT